MRKGVERGKRARGGEYEIRRKHVRSGALDFRALENRTVQKLADCIWLYQVITEMGFILNKGSSCQYMKKKICATVWN